MSEKGSVTQEKRKAPGRTLVRYLGIIACSSALSSMLSPNVVAVQDTYDAYKDDSTLSSDTTQLARQILDADIEVHCSRSLDDEANKARTGDRVLLGFVSPYTITLPFSHKVIAEYTPDTMHIQSSLCEDLLGIDAAGNNGPTRIPGDALNVIAHEYEHIMGTRDEAAASCYAGQRMPSYLFNAGMNIDSSIDMTRNLNRDFMETSPEEYKSDDCRDGGRLDINQYPTFMTP